MKNCILIGPGAPDDLGESVENQFALCLDGNILLRGDFEGESPMLYIAELGGKTPWENIAMALEAVATAIRDRQLDKDWEDVGPHA